MIKFRVLDTNTNKIIRDSSQYVAQVYRVDGVAEVTLNSDKLKPLRWTGEQTVDGTDVFDGDVVEATVTTDRGDESITDEVHWQGAAWRFGNFEGTLADVVLITVKGNKYEMPWPLPAA